MLHFILYIIVLLAAVVVIIDWIPLAKDWLGRIRIGRYRTREQWQNMITEVGAKWLKRTPTIRKTDHTRLIVIDMLRGQYASRTIQHWQEAALLLGLASSASSEYDRGHKAVIEQYISDKFTEEGQWRESPKQVDAGILAYAILKLGKSYAYRCKPALDEIWHLIRDHIGSDGTVQYRKAMKDYRYVDTIGFICPFLVAYGVQFKHSECIQLALKQLEHYERFGMLDKQYIPSHAYHLEDGMPAGLYGWGRGLGWFAIGLADAWNELPDHMEEKKQLEGMMTRFAQAVLRFQQPSGCWNWSVNRAESRPDSSATAILGWFLTQAGRIGDIAEVCVEGAERASVYLMGVTRRNGVIDFSQGDTKDIGVYSTHFSILPFTQGFAIRLCMEDKM
ncbi:glycoside hydrolase family 88 protein [Paenibacillus chungangensis]|uniref:Glycoside hydrolase family 88 protein n=1 Tax=Paenibacillus chungangensis TaxID=696535 RepID=A0ABW3HV27_9BACL